MIERRQASRKRAEIPVKIRLFEEAEGYKASIKLEGNVRDISINGFGLEGNINSAVFWELLKDFTPDTGKVFLLHLEALASDKKLFADGTIIRCHVTDPERKELRIGISINKMDADIRNEWFLLAERS
jgi:hypothetical protein